MFADPQKSLVPIGGNFYVTPDTPADPRDCDRYPNSPYCNGGFLDITPIRIIPEIVADECNFGVAVEGTLGFIKLPVLQVVHRSSTPSCQPPLPQPPPPTPKGDDCQTLYCNDGSSITAVLSTRYARPGAEGNPGGFAVGTSAQIVMDYNYNLAIATAAFIVKGLSEDAANGSTSHPLFKNIHRVVEHWGQEGYLAQTSGLPLFQVATTIDGITSISDDEFVTSDDPPTSLSRYDGNIEYNLTRCRVLCDYLINDTLDIYSHQIYEAGYWVATRFRNPLCKPPTPPPPPPKMQCCPGQSNNDQLLKLILKRIGTLPVEVPASYLTKNGVQPAQTKQIESLVDFSAWFAERFDETIGEFEITIEIDDADLSKKGDQKQTIRLPNLGEAIAEIFSLLIHSKINNDLMLNIVNRNLIESGQIKQSEFKIFSALNALIEYVGFPTNSTSEKMPLTFKPGELSFDKFLKEGEIDVSVLTYTEKNTLAAAMHTLLQAAAIIRAVHFRKTPGNDQQIASTIKNDLAQFLGDNGNLSEQIKAFLGNVDKVYGIDNKSG